MERPVDCSLPWQNIVCLLDETFGYGERRMQRQKFGELALELGYLSDEQLARALSIQQEEDTASQPRRPLGIICMQEGFLTFNQVVRILERQETVVAADA